MIHVRAMKTPRGKHGPLYGFHGSDFGPPTTGEQVRRGVLLATVAAVLILVGLVVLFVWFDMTSKIPLGPLVIILGTVLLVLSMRQFWIVWKHRHNPTSVQAAQVQEEEDMPYGSMMEMDSLDTFKAEKLQCHQRGYIENSQFPQLGANPCFPVITPSIIPTNRDAKQAINSVHNPQQGLEVSLSYKRQQFADSGYYRQLVLENSNATEPPSVQQIVSSLATPDVTTVVCDNRVRSCCDLTSVSRSSSAEAPNPRPVIRYSQGQLEMLDRVNAAAVAGRTSPILVKSTPSQKSLGERSISPQHSSHRSLSLSVERTDVVETI